MSDRPQGDDWWLASDGRWYPPQAVPGPRPGDAERPVSQPQRSSWGLTATVAGFLIADAALFGIAAVAYFGWLRMLLTEAGQSGAQALVRAEDNATMALAFAALGLIVTGVLFLTWFFQAYRAAMPGHERRRWGSGWTIGAWFIPFANFVIPKLVMNEIDRMSSADPGPDPEAWMNEPRTPVSDLWWAAWVTAAVVFSVGSAFVDPDVDAEVLRTGVTLTMSSLAVYAIAAITGARLVLTIGRRIRDRERSGSPGR
jgi:hypothetical protein